MLTESNLVVAINLFALADRNIIMYTKSLLNKMDIIIYKNIYNLLIPV